MRGFILLYNFKEYKAGTIGLKNKKQFLPENAGKVMDIPEELYEILSLENYNFLKDFPLNKRLKKNREFDILIKLDKGDKCYNKNSKETCKILERIIIDEILQFKIKTKNGPCVVKASEIKKDKSKKDFIFEANEEVKNRCKNLSRKVYSSFHSRIKSNGSDIGSENYFDFQSLQSQRKTDSMIVTVDVKYLSVKSNLSNSSFIEGFETFTTNELIEIHESNIFGRISFFASLNEDIFVGISINPLIAERLHDMLEQILFTDTFLTVPFNGIIVPSVYIERFNHPLLISQSAPFIKEESIVFSEQFETAEEEKIITVKFYLSLLGTTYGTIKERIILNGERCFGINMIRYGQDISKIKYLKEKDASIVENVTYETKVFDGVFILSECIITLEQYQSKTWENDDEVSFVLLSSGNKVCGNIVCTVKINNFEAAIVRVIKVSGVNETFVNFKCSKELLTQLNIDDKLYENAYLIPLSMLHKDQTKELLDIMKFILKNKDNWSENIINEAMAKNDESILSYVILNIETEVDLERSPDLLNILFERGDFETLRVLLTKAKLGDNSNLTLLDLGLKCLQSQNMDLFRILIDKCSDRNILLENKETFVTNLFKTGIAEDIIIEIIESKKFNISLDNGEEKTPLLLACERLWIPTIETITKSIKLDGRQVRQAIDFIFSMGEDNEDHQKKFHGARILNMYLKEINEEIQCCKVCLDKECEISLDCGHVFCKTCSDNFDICPLCKRETKEKRKLYF